MVTLKELEKQRLEKIKSLSNSQIENYDADSGVAFDDYVKSQPTFNIITGELVVPSD